MFDEDGNDNGVGADYYIVSQEFLKNPKLLSLEDILCVMENLDDDCFELSMQFDAAKIIYYGILAHGQEGIEFYLKNLGKVPEQGRFHGWHFPVQWLLREEENYNILKSAIQQDSKTKILLVQILSHIRVYPERKEELVQLLKN